MLVRLVDGEYEGKDTVATVRIEQGVTIDTGLCVCLTAEVISLAFADSHSCSVEDLLVDTEVNTVEELLTVDDGIETMQTCGVE